MNKYIWMLVGTLLPVVIFSFIGNSADRLAWILMALLVLTVVLTAVLKLEEFREKRALRKSVPFKARIDIDFCLFVLSAFVLEVVVMFYALWLNNASLPSTSKLLLMQSFTSVGGGLMATIVGMTLCCANIYVALLLNRRLLSLHHLDLGWKSVLKIFLVVVLVVVVLTFVMIFAGVETQSDSYRYSIVLFAVVCGLATIAYECLVRNRKSLMVIPYLMVSSLFLAIWALPVMGVFIVGGAVYAILWYKNRSYEKARVAEHGVVITPKENKQQIAKSTSETPPTPNPDSSTGVKGPERKRVEGL